MMFVYPFRFDKLIRFGQTLQTLLTDLETARGIKDERNGRLLQVCSSDVQIWQKMVVLGFVNLQLRSEAARTRYHATYDKLLIINFFAKWTKR